MAQRQRKKFTSPLTSPSPFLDTNTCIRSIELTRTRNGYGFTLSGQRPCILTQVKGHAAAAGLRSGDYLIAVNGQNVSRSHHEDVVRLITASSGILKLDIVEKCNYDTSESSDDCGVPFDSNNIRKERPRYPYRHRKALYTQTTPLAAGNGRAYISANPDHNRPLSSQHHHHHHHYHPRYRRHDTHSAPISRSNKQMLDLVLKQRLAEIGRNMSDDDEDADDDDKNKNNNNRGPNPQLSKTFPNESSLRNVASSSLDQHQPRAVSALFTDSELRSILYPSLERDQIPNAIPRRELQSETSEEDVHNRALLRAVVGYLGTIEMPKDPQIPGSQLQSIRNCIRRLRIEKKVNTTILLAVYPENIILAKVNGHLLAEFSAEKVTFCGVCPDDSKFFGLVTSNGCGGDISEENEDINKDQNEPNSNSCHVFITSPSTHQMHYRRAKAFGIKCTLDPVTGNCLEFPESADSILRVIVGLYRNRLGVAPPAMANIDVNVSPAHSSSSNSDSGIHEGANEINQRNNSMRNIDRPAPIGAAAPLVNDQNGQCSSSSHEFNASSLSLTSSSTPLKVQSLPHYSGHSNTCSTGVASGTGTKHASLDRVNKQTRDNASLDRTLKQSSSRDSNSNGQFTSSILDLSYNSEMLDVQLNATHMRETVHKYFKMKQEIERREMQQLKQTKQKHPQQQTTMASSSNSDIQRFFINNNGVSSDEITKKLNETINERITDETGSLCIDSEVLKCNDSRGLTISVIGCVPIDKNKSDNADADTEIGSQDVAPPTTQGEDDSDDDDDDDDTTESAISEGKIIHVTENTKRWIKPTHGLSIENLQVMNNEISLTYERDTNPSIANSQQGLDHMNDCNDNTTSTTSNVLVNCNNGNTLSERPVDVGWVGGWANDFGQLLADSVGIKVFSEFLKKEFSHENIEFWIACERYKKLVNKDEMKRMAKDIFDTHLCIGAPDAVNVDGHARIIAENGIDDPNPKLFILAQKQRFLKSDLYKECASRELSGRPLPYQESADEMSDVPQQKSKIAKANVDPKPKKRSLIPWNRGKSYKLQEKDKTPSKETIAKGIRIRKLTSAITASASKKKHHHQSYNCTKIVTDDMSSHSDHTGSQSSLTSEQHPVPVTDIVMVTKKYSNNAKEVTKSRETLHIDHNDHQSNNSSSVTCSSASPGECNRENCHISRVILPDRSTAIAKTQNGEKISEMLQKLLEKRHLQYSAVEVFATECDKPIDQNSDVSTLGCKEIRVEQRILFRLDMPCKKIIGIKARPGKLCGDVFRSILPRYGYRLEHVVLQIANSSKSISLNSPISTIDNQRIIVSVKDDLDEWGWDANSSRMPVALQSDKTLNIDSLSRDAKHGHDYDKTKMDTEEIGTVDYEWQYTDIVKRNDNNTIEDTSPGKENTYPMTVVTKDGDSIKRSAMKDSGVHKDNNRLLSTETASGLLASCDGNMSFSDDSKSEAFLRSLMISSQHIPDSVNNRTTLSPYISKPKPIPRPKPSLTSSQTPSLRGGGTGSGGGVGTGGTVPKPTPRTALLTPYKNLDIKFSKCNISPIERVNSNTNFGINDIDLDVTLKSLQHQCNSNFERAHSQMDLDATLTPSKVPYPNDQVNVAHNHEANYTPPTPLYCSQPQTLPNYVYRNDIIRKPPVRRLSSDPPPLPPKAKPRGPPPRPPSRQQMVFHQNSEGNRYKIMENYI